MHVTTNNNERAAQFAVVTASAQATSIIDQHCWMGPRGAAGRLGINLSELRRLRESGGLPFHHRGNGGFLYDAGSLDAWLAARVSAARPRRLSRYEPVNGNPTAPPPTPTSRPGRVWGRVGSGRIR